MVMVKRVKVWTKNWSGTREVRIYIDMTDGRRGGFFLTGNPYQERGSIDGQITNADVKAAREVAVWDSKWHTLYEEDLR